MSDLRLAREREHVKYLAEFGAGEIWNWESPAGRDRWRRRVEMLIKPIRPGMRVLELGCGTGYFTKEMAHKQANITAIDIYFDFLAIARSVTDDPAISYIEGNAYQMGLRGEMFDMVVGSSILHHPDIRRALEEIFRVLKCGGIICFTEPNMMNPQIALQKNIAWLKRRLGDSPDEAAFFRWSMKKLLNDQGFRQVLVTPFDFLHPAIPGAFVRPANWIGRCAEKTPLRRKSPARFLLSLPSRENLAHFARQL